MTSQKSEQRFRGVGSGNKRATSERAKLVDAIFPNRWKRSVCVAWLGAAFVVGCAASVDLASVRASEAAEAAAVATLAPTPEAAFEYETAASGATITGVREAHRTATALYIPKEIGGRPVRKIAPNACAGLERLERLYCDSFVSVGERAFADCVALKTVRFSLAGSTVGKEAFAGCSSLETFDVAGVARIEASAFVGCRKLKTFENRSEEYRRWRIVDGLLTSEDGRTLIACPGGKTGEIVLPEGVVAIGPGAFAGGLVESVVLPQSLEIVDERAFAGCAALKSVVGAPEALETIGPQAFAGCGALERFDWPERLQIIEKQAFAMCRALESAKILSVRRIGERAFSGCSKLATLELPSGTREIGAFAFDGTALKTFKAPRELETMSAWSLAGVPLESVEIEEGNQAFKIVDGAVLSADGKTLYYRPTQAPGTTWKIPEGVRVVVRGALDGNASLVSVAIPDGVETIGERAFSGCSALRKLAIPASVRRIDDRFLGCDSLETFEVAEGNPSYRSADGALVSKDGKTLYRVARKGGAGTTKSSEGLRNQGAKRAIPDGVERLVAGAIGDDRLMTSLAIPASVKRIDADVFGNCERLRSLTIPASVERLDERFERCNELVDFRVAPENPNYKSVDGALLSRDGKTFYRFVVAGWAYRGKQAKTAEGFNGYEYVVPEGVETIKQNAFRNSSRLAQVVLPQSLRTIERSAFSGAIALTSVAIPNGVQKIEDGAFFRLREVVLSSNATFAKSAFTNEPAKLAIRVDDPALERAQKIAEAKRSAEEIAQKTFLWEIGANGSATITGVRDKTATSLDVPETIEGAPVKDLAYGAFANLLQLKTARIGANVERINGAFQNCVNLESVEFPPASDGSGESKLHAILNGGFQGCSSLKKFEAPRSLVSLGTFAFADCSALETVKLSPRTDEIGQSSFSNCSSLREIDVPDSDGLLFIGGDAFKGCDALKSFDAPRKLSGLGWNAFGELDRPFQFKLHPESKRLQDVGGMILSRDGKTVCAYFGPKTGELVIPEGVERIGQVFGSILKGADFETIRLPKSLRVVQRQAFMESKSLKRVELPEDSALEEIGANAFSGCEALESFAWPKSLKKIGIGAFSDCALKEFGGVPALETIGAYAFSNCGALSTIELPSGLREIGNGAFSECAATSLKIPASVQTLGEAAFTMGPLEKIEVEEGSETLKVVDGALLSKDGKTLRRLPSALKLTSYKIPDGVEIVERAALGGNVTLETVEIPSTVKTIGPDAFYRCVALKKISIPASVETMSNAFIRCDSLEHFEVDPSNPRFKSENGALLSADGKTFYGIVAVERDAEAEERAAVRLAADAALDSAASADAVGNSKAAPKPIYKNPVYRVPDGVETIAASAFNDGSGMRNAFTEIVLPESVTSIGRLAFERCKQLEKAFIPKNVAKIEEAAFKYCDALKTVEIDPENPNYRIENDMLLSKDGKTFYEVIVDRGATVLKIPEGVERIAKTWIWSAFEFGPTYTEVVLPETLTSLGENAFTDWQNLTSITIPKGVKTIEARAFYNCPALSEVVLQSRDTSLNAYAFYNFPKSPKPTIRVEEPKELEKSVSNIEGAVVEQHGALQTSRTSGLKANDDASDADLFEWRAVQSDEVAILGVRDKTATTLVVPEILGGKKVKTISDGAFAGLRELKTVRLSRNLERIGAAAFEDCVKLENVEFVKDENGDVASKLREIDSGAFRNCVSLKSFDAPDSLGKLGLFAFSGCSALESATLGKDLRRIEVSAFADCVSLSRVDCSRCQSLTQIGSSAFLNCDALTTFAAPKSLILISANAFGERSKPLAFTVDPASEYLQLVDGFLLTKPNKRLIAYFGERSGALVVPEGVKAIGESVFAGADFEEARLPKSLQSVEPNAFAFCESLKSVVIPEDSALETIKERSFVQCKALETFDWPKPLKRIGEFAFSDCAALKSLKGATSLVEIGDSAFLNCESLTTVELPSGLLKIGPRAFLDAGFASIKIPASVQVVGSGAFANSALEKFEIEKGSETLKVVDGALLSKDGKTLHRLPTALKLTSYKIPDGVKVIGRSAFGGNVTLEKVELPATVEKIEKDAFYRCLSLKEIAIPAKTWDLDKDAFAFCDALERFEVDPNNDVYKSENGALLSADGKTLYKIVAVERDPSAEPFVVEPTQEGEEPRLIAAYKSFVFRVPDGVTTISENAFYDSRKARNAFEEVVLPQGLIAVGTSAFNACERLETIRIPASVAQLGPAPEICLPTTVFVNCDALKTFEVAPESKTFRSEDGMLLSADGKKIYGVFVDKDRSVWKIPEGVVSTAQLMGGSLKATEVVLPESLEEITSNSFVDCENLTSITIPKNVRRIDVGAFFNCPRLAEVVLKSSETVYFSSSFAKVAPNLTIRVEEDGAANGAANASEKDAPQPPQPTQTLEPSQVKADDSTAENDAEAGETLAADAFEWREYNGGATILKVNDKKSQSLVIPETLGGLPVKAIAPSAFAGMAGLKSVRFSKSLETIGRAAFLKCAKLETIEFAKDENGGVASNLREIAEDAFNGCAALKSFAAPESLVEVGSLAFSECSALESATFGKNLETLGQYAFGDCASLSRVDVSTCEKLGQLSDYLFSNCGALSSFDAPKSLRWVAGTTFAGRTTPLAFNVDPESAFLKLVDGCLITVPDKRLVAYFGERNGALVVPEGVVEIKGAVFADASFETVRFPKSLRFVNNKAFIGCEALKSVVVPEDSALESIGWDAFRGCKALETFDWPKSLKEIADGAFAGCESLNSLSGATSLERIGASAFWNCRALATVDLPSGLREIGGDAFADAGYQTIKIPASVQVVGAGAFASVSPLEKIELEDGNEKLKLVDGALLSKDGKVFFRLPKSLKAKSYKLPTDVEVIENAAFAGNLNLETVEFAPTLRMIKANAFYRCVALREIAIPAKTFTIEDDAFAACHSLERFEVDPNNAVYKSENGALLSKDGTVFYKLVAVERDPNAAPLFLIPLEENEANVAQLLKTTRIIPAYKSSVYRVPDGVTTINENAFNDKSDARNRFKEIVLPEGLAQIKPLAFSSCSRLEKIRIPASVSQIGGAGRIAAVGLAFGDCDALKTFEVAPENETFSAEDGMLLNNNGTALYGVVVNKKRSVWKLPASVVSLVWLSQGAQEATEIVLPEGLADINARTFRDYPNLTSITIPASVVSIEDFAFCDCPRLAQVVLKSSATKCNDGAFYRCAPNLTVRVDDGATAAQAEANLTETFELGKLKDGTLVVKGVVDKSATTLTIPETVDGVRVSQIDAKAFEGARELRMARIPASVIAIGYGAFMNCLKLEKIEFAKAKNGESASSLRSIASNAFRGCAALKSFEAPDSLAFVEPRAFEGCAALETVSLGKGMLDVDVRAFADCVSLRRFDMSQVERLRSFNRTSFDGASPDFEIVFPRDNPRLTPEGFLLTDDGKALSAFLGRGVAEIAIPEGVERIEKNAFCGQEGLETARLPKSLRSVGDSAFCACKSLKRVVVPEDSALESIDAKAFLECYALERFDWPKSLQTIGDRAFSSCRSLKSFTGATSVWKIGSWAFCDCESLTEVELPNGLLEIGASAFAECGFTSIKIPASVQVIGDAALAVTPLKTIEVDPENRAVKVVDGALLSKDGKSFFRLPPGLKLKSFKIPEGVETIERAALGGNETLESVEIPTSVFSIERNAFYRNSSLTEIFIPAGVKALDDPFPLCDSLERFEVDPENAFFKSENGALLSKDGKTFYRIVAVERDPSGKPIVLQANESLAKMTKRDEGERSIPAYKNDVYVVPEGVERLYAEAFRDVRRTRNAFTEIVLPQSLRSVDARVFQYCPRLETLRIPANVEVLDAAAFLDCDTLKTFEVDPNNVNYSAQDGMLLSAGGKRFYAVVADKERRVLKIPEGVEEATPYETDSNKFAELLLPESLKKIDAGAFSNCENLTTVTIPQNVYQIGPLAFSNSPKLAEIVLKSSATSCQPESFNGVAPNFQVRVETDAPTSPTEETTDASEEPEEAEETEEAVWTLQEATKVFQLEFSGDEATIVSVKNKDAISVEAPRKIGEYTVTKIAGNAFGNMHSLVEVRLPSTIREIGDYAFVNCVHLEQAVIPSATEKIGVGAFTNCRGLRAIGVSLANKTFKVVRGAVLSADGKTLYAYPTARAVDKVYEVPDGVETIAAKAFGSNLYVKEVKFPWTLKRIEKEAFMGCETLEAIHFFPVVNRLETIGESAFWGCNALKSVNLPDGIRRIERAAFGGTGLEKVEFYPVELEVRPGLVVDSEAFSASNLTSFEIPETLQKFNLKAVASSRKLALKLPPNLKTPIDWASEIVCPGLSSFEVDPSCAVYRVVDGVLLSKDGKTLYRYPSGRDASEYVVPNGVERIVRGAFDGAPLRTLRLPGTLKTLEICALARLPELETIEIPEGVESCGNGLFYGCGKLSSAKLPATLRSFDFATSFNGCSALAAVELAPGFKLAKSVDGALLSPDGSDVYFFPPRNGATKFNIPESVLRIGDAAFREHQTLKTVRFGRKVETVGRGAFENCKSLKTLVLNDGLRVLQTNAFSGCSALQAVEIPDSVLNLGGAAFCGCSSLTTVKIPAKASEVAGSFWGCAALRAIEVDPANVEYKSVDGVLLSKDGKTLYEYPAGKKNVEYRVPNGVVKIVGRAFRADATATRPAKIILPSSAQTVEPYAFVGRENLEIVAPQQTKFGDFRHNASYTITTY